MYCLPVLVDITKLNDKKDNEPLMKIILCYKISGNNLKKDLQDNDRLTIKFINNVEFRDLGLLNMKLDICLICI